jgi:hypothetical protein
MKNILHQGFQHSTESQLIEIMKMKMPLVQFVSIIKMEVIHIWKKYIEPRISTTLAIQID